MVSLLSISLLLRLNAQLHWAFCLKCTPLSLDSGLLPRMFYPLPQLLYCQTDTFFKELGKPFLDPFILLSPSLYDSLIFAFYFIMLTMFVITLFEISLFPGKLFLYEGREYVSFVHSETPPWPSTSLIVWIQSPIDLDLSAFIIALPLLPCSPRCPPDIPSSSCHRSLHQLIFLHGPLLHFFPILKSSGPTLAIPLEPDLMGGLVVCLGLGLVLHLPFSG